jgi:hypothetical protein
MEDDYDDSYSDDDKEQGCRCMMYIQTKIVLINTYPYINEALIGFFENLWGLKNIQKTV